MRPLSPDEQALWARVVASVRPFHHQAPPLKAEARQADTALVAPARSSPSSPRARPLAPKPPPNVGTTLDGSWDRRLARGLVQPDATLDLHGLNLASAYAVLDDRLDQAVASGARLLLLITGKPPGPDRPNGRGAIRAAMDDWLQASRHASAIASVRVAHARHGGAGAHYLVLRRAGARRA